MHMINILKENKTQGKNLRYISGKLPERNT